MGSGGERKRGEEREGKRKEKERQEGREVISKLS